MRPTLEIIRFPEKSSVKCWFTAATAFASAWHFHPELEIKFVELSRGLRIVGDSIVPFREGDLVLLGPNLPHVWISDPCAIMGQVRGVVVQFLDTFLGPEIWDAPEFDAAAKLIRRSRHGIAFGGDDAGEIARLLLQMAGADAVRRVLLLLEILDRMAHSRRQTLLCSANYTPKLNPLDAKRIAVARRYVEEHLTGEISEVTAAGLVRMSAVSFSSYFRQKMGCTFSAYVNQLRISRAIHLMVEERMNISEACFASGFNNLSNFNRRFLAIKRMTPSAFLRELDRANVGPARGLPEAV
ncbi:MAG: AraC family transcriptional regulator [Opitutaceae bacterium]